ncbi:MAG: alpha/beta fold hydrolase [Gammaproteobacteria bacterium]|nr:alpha/beta fold hydrolase [Gammaproteobacteria bacterium]
MSSSRILARVAVALAALALVSIASLRLEAAGEGVAVSHHRIDTTPVTAFAPRAGRGARPVVVIAHGFAGSQQLMLPFALTLARRGYLVLTFDFPGHGRNVVPMAGGPADFAASTRALLEALAAVATAARTWPGSDGRLALLGHSMASDIVIRHAMADDAVRATVALSAYSPVVTATSPRNLLVVTGEFEPQMLRDEGLRIAGLALGGARAAAGRTYGEFAAGTARRFVLAEGVEHVSVLYSRTALLEALDWIERSLGTPPVAGPRLPDDRGGWLALLCLGLVALAWPLASLLPRAVAARAASSASPAPAPTRGIRASTATAAARPGSPGAGRAVVRAADDEPLELPSMSVLDDARPDVAARAASMAPRLSSSALADDSWAPGGRGAAVPAGAATAVATAEGEAPATLGWRGLWPVAVLPALLTPLLLWQLPGGFLPLLLGDYLLLHFAVYGLVTTAGLWLARARRPPLAGVQPLALAFAALAATLYGVFAIGVPLDRYVTSFAPVGVRGTLALALFCGTLPYFLADEWLVRGASRARGGPAFTKLMFLVSLALAVALNPGRLFFLAIVVPVILVSFVIYGLLGRWVFQSIGHPWAGAFASAVAFAWLIAATFPVVSS